MRLIRTSLILLTAAATLLPAVAQNYTFEFFEIPYPPSSPPALNSTRASAINNRGAIVGSYSFYRGSQLFTYGFKRHANGVLEYPIKYPDDTSTVTIPKGINQYGDIVGSYKTSTYQDRGFLFINGIFSSIGSLDPESSNTIVDGINNRGDFVGHYILPLGAKGFLGTNGTVTTTGFPGPLTAQPIDIAWDGSIVGYYGPELFVPPPAGFLRGPKGNFLRFNVRHSTIPTIYNMTVPNGITNAAGKIVGWFQEDSNLQYGFVWDYSASLARAEAAPQITDLDQSPRILITPDIVILDLEGHTSIEGINSEGVIVGTVVRRIGGTRRTQAFIGTPIR